MSTTRTSDQTAYSIARTIATGVCAYLDHTDYLTAWPVARDAAYGVLAAAPDDDFASRSIAAQAAAITAGADALGGVA